MISLRRAIIARTILTLSVIGCLGAAAAYRVALFEADQFMDDYMRQFSALSPAALQATSGAKSALLEPEDQFEQVLWPDSGEPAFAAPGLQHLVRPTSEGFDTVVVDGVSWRTYALREGRSMRVLAQRTLARSELAGHAAIETSVIIVIAMLVVFLVVTLTVNRAMRHFSRVGSSVAARGVDAEDPLPLDGLPREIRPLVGAMNVLIERQGEALRRQRLFIADSAHELRTPLTALRLQIENLQNVEGTASPAATAALRSGIVRASSMLNQLLQMARFDVPRSKTEDEEVDLSEIMKQCVADLVDIADGAGIDVGFTKCDPIKARLPSGDIQVLVSNIVDNAVAYSARGGRIDCSLRWHGDDALMEIADTGPGVRPEDLPRLFDRFFRAAPLDKMGSGLGLAIVKAIADRHGLGVRIENRADRSGLRVCVLVPRALRVDAQEAHAASTG